MNSVLFFLLIGFSLPVTAQFHTVFNYSVPEGLPSAEVYEIYQDKKGFLWFATDNGVARYDGNEFQVFHVKSGLTDPVVFGFSEDDAGRIWFRTFSGRLCYFNGESIEPYRYNDQLIENGENGLFQFIYDSKSNDLWFTLRDFSGKIDSTGKSSRHRYFTRSFFLQSINGEYLLGGDPRYSIRNIIINDQKYPIQLTDTSDFRFFNAIEYDDKIYVSIYRDVFEYDRHSVKRIFTSDHPIISLSTDRQKNLWMGYLNHGAEIFRGTQKGWSPGFLRNKSVTKVFQDNAHGFWFSTLESGVYHAPDFRIENYDLPTHSRLKAVLSMGDTVLLGDQSGNLFIYGTDNKELLSKKTYPHAVYSLFQDRFKNVWISAGVDIIRHNSRLQVKNRYPQLIATTLTDGPEGCIWALGGIRITHFDKQGTLISSEAPDVIYRTMHVADSALYLAGRTGLHVRDKEMNFREAPPAFSDLKITQIQPINDSTLLLATLGNGLILVNKKTWNYRQFDTSHQFLTNNIYCIKKSDSILWIGTDKGMIAVSIENLFNNQPGFYQLSRKAGLVGDKVNFILTVKDNVWAFSDNGFSVIPKSLATHTEAKPVFYVKRLIAGTDTLTSRQLAGIDRMILPNHKNHLTFTFGFISFSNQDIFLRYRISPGSEWIMTTQRTLQFFSIAPGNYLLELQYSLDNIRWNTAFRPLDFAIDAPWWMKWYTQLGALLFFLLIGYSYFRYRQSIYKQRNHYLNIINNHQQKLIQSEIETLERERNRIARELHDGVGTNLTAIKLMVNQLLQNYHAPQARDVEEQFQIALTELKDIIYGLTPPSLGRYGLFTALKNYVSKLNKSLDTMISLEIFGADTNNYEFNIMVFRIVQELISNSIKHSSAKHITIHINSFEDMLNIVYEDDGVGFSYEAGRKGLGLDNIESRIHSVNGTLKFDSGGHGICYTIDIPLHPERETA